ncbi:hypothetical protein [Flintibacter muris]|uniref:hypothetical protein n=1 Tax=Flintibacter muris TaxID=2941327 RepID=UPI00203EC344|nr:hypothetical protein [Flintibacter muris]
MATTKTIAVQYKLRGDTLANLEAKNAIYAVNEPIVVLIPADTDAGTKAAILLKLGDGTTAFNDLPYITALAGDVPEWAKAATKPVYEAKEIKNIDTYIAGKVQDTDTQYKLEQDATDPHILILSAKALADEDYTEVVRITTADTTYTAADGSVTVDADAKTIGVNMSAEADNGLEKKDDGLYVKDRTVDVVKKATANAGYIASYQVTVDGTVVGADINIPKDYLVKSADIKVVAAADDPYAGAVVGDKYIDFVVNTVGGDGNESHIYLSVQDLVDEYTAGDGIEISATNVIAIKLGTNANGLKVGAAGLELDEATTTAAGAMSATDKTKLDGVAEGATKVEASDTNGNVKIGGTETTVYTLPDTVVHDTDTIILDGGNA